MTFQLQGNPGDIAIESVNITKDPKGKLPLQRSFTVRRMTVDLEWKVIGYYSEHFGPDPEVPEEDSMYWMVESPNGMLYQEPWFTEEEREKVFSKWSGHFGDNVGIAEFLLKHYSTQPIPT